MAETTMSLEKLEGGALDLKVIEVYASGDENVVNEPRLAPGVNVGSLAALNKHVKDKVDLQIATLPAGRKGYATLALAQAAQASLAANTLVEVTDDTTTTNNGVYLWDGTTLVKSGNDVLGQAKAYTDSYATVKPVLLSTNANLDTLASGYYFVGADSTASTMTGLPPITSPKRGVLFSMRDGTVHYQRFVHDTGTGYTVYERSGNAKSSTDPAFAWLDWVKVVSHSEFDSNITSLNSAMSAKAEINLFPNLSLKNDSATNFLATTISESGYPVLMMNKTAAASVFYETPVTQATASGQLLTFNAEIYCDVTGTASGDISIVALDSANAVLATSTSVYATLANTWHKITTTLTLPTNTAKVRYRFINRNGTNNTVCKFRNPSVSSDYPLLRHLNPFATTVKNIFVDGVNGSDNNSGTRSSPLKTITAAIGLGSENTVVTVAEGDYYEAPQLNTNKIVNLEIRAARNSQVRLIGGTQVTGFTQTSGYSKVWQASVATNPIAGSDRAGYWLYQHGVADIESLITKRYPQHHGRTNRLDSTCRIWKVDSIAAIESATRPSWFWASGVLYLSCVGSDPNNANIRINSSTISPFYSNNATKDQSVKIVGIESYYWLHGFRLWDFASVELVRCKAIGNHGNGFEISDTNYSHLEHCEGGGNWVDGCGGHTVRTNATKQSNKHTSDYCYYHDNGDDGFSFHENFVVASTAVLTEYNGDRGIADAVGCHAVHVSPVAYKNGQGQGLWVIDDGAGFACVGASVDGGTSTDSALHNAVSDGNLVNYNLAGGDSNTLNAYNCVSLDAVNTHYNASQCVMTLVDCKSSGTGTIKTVGGTATISIKNSNLVT